MECVVNDDNRIELYMSYNKKEQWGNYRLPNLQNTVTLVNSSSENGNIYCTFTREKITTVEGKIYDLSKDKYFLLIAGGTELKGQFLLKITNISVFFHNSPLLTIIFTASQMTQLVTMARQNQHPLQPLVYLIQVMQQENRTFSTVCMAHLWLSLGQDVPARVFYWLDISSRLGLVVNYAARISGLP